MGRLQKVDYSISYLFSIVILFFSKVIKIYNI